MGEGQKSLGCRKTTYAGEQPQGGRTVLARAWDTRRKYLAANSRYKKVVIWLPGGLISEASSQDRLGSEIELRPLGDLVGAGTEAGGVIQRDRRQKELSYVMVRRGWGWRCVTPAFKDPWKTGLQELRTEPGWEQHDWPAVEPVAEARGLLLGVGLRPRGSQSDRCTHRRKPDELSQILQPPLLSAWAASGFPSPPNSNYLDKLCWMNPPQTRILNQKIKDFSLSPRINIQKYYVDYKNIGLPWW